MRSDFRHAFRQLRRNPAFSLVALLSLALGIGATTSVFSIISGALLRPEPYRQPEQLVFVTSEKLVGGNSDATVSGKQFDEWQKQSRSFSGMAGYEWMFTFLVHPDGNESLEGMVGSAGLFRVLGITAAVGRTFADDEATVQNHPVVLLGNDLWRRRFGSDPKIIGKQIQLNRLPPLTVVGVMPPGLRFLPSRRGSQEPNYNLYANVDFWLPGTPNPAGPWWETWNVVARLKDGVILNQARAEMTGVASSQAKTDPKLSQLTVAVTPVKAVLDSEIRRIVLPLFGAVCLVLLVAGVNVTGLLLVRGLGRQKELAVRAALGASRSRLMSLALIESVLLALGGGILGILFAFTSTKGLLLVAPGSIPRLDAVAIDSRVLAFASIVSLLTGLSSGWLAAWQISRPDLSRALKAGGTGSSSGFVGRQVLNALVAAELALTLILLIGAGLMAQTVLRLSRFHPGFETREIVTMVVTSLKPDIFEFHRTALEKVQALPGVSSAAFVWGLPLTGNQWNAAMVVEGRPTPTSPQDNLVLPLRSVTPDYFKLMGIRLMGGRLFDDHDRKESPSVAIINEEMARRNFPGATAIGKHLSFPGDKPMEIVGVVGDLHNRALNAPLEAEVYLPFFQSPAFSKHLVLRTSADPMETAAAATRELRRIDPGVVVEKIKTMDRIRGDSVSAQRFAMTLISAFSLVAVLLAVIGIYGVMSYAVTQRSKEIGVRMAIGAQRHHVVWLILKQALVVAMVGIILGLAGAVALTRVLHSLLFNLSPTDPVTFVVIAGLLPLVVILACWWPTRRATKIDPIVVLRSE